MTLREQTKIIRMRMDSLDRERTWIDRQGTAIFVQIFGLIIMFACIFTGWSTVWWSGLIVWVAGFLLFIYCQGRIFKERNFRNKDLRF